MSDVAGDRLELVEQLLHCKSFSETTRHVFEGMRFVDARFFEELQGIPAEYRNSICEAVLQASGLLEDPEVIGAREELTIANALTLLASVGTVWLPAPPPAQVRHQDIRRLLGVAAEQARIGKANSAQLLAIVHYAMGLVGRATVVEGSMDTVALLQALGDVARARVLKVVPGRQFDALQYLRRGMKEIERQYDHWRAEDRGELESELNKIGNEMFDLRSLLDHGFEAGGGQ